MAAQTGHKVTMVDMSQDIVEKAKGNIQKSLQRVAKKKFEDDSASIGQMDMALRSLICELCEVVQIGVNVASTSLL